MDSSQVSVDVKNTGDVSGDEVVQLYIRDLVGSVTRPVKELRGFEKVTLEPGETKTVSFTLTPNDLAMYDIDMNRVVEPGDFKVFVGTNSEGVLERNTLLSGSKYTHFKEIIYCIDLFAIND